MPNITYQKLTPSESLLLSELNQLFAAEFEDNDNHLSNPPSENYLAELLADQHFIAIVARDESRIVGGLAAYVFRKFEQERKEIYIYDLAVATTHRRQGIATELINTLKQIAKEIGVYLIFVQAENADEPAIKLYEKFAARQDIHHFEIAID